MANNTESGAAKIAAAKRALEDQKAAMAKMQAEMQALLATIQEGEAEAKAETGGEFAQTMRQLVTTSWPSDATAFGDIMAVLGSAALAFTIAEDGTLEVKYMSLATASRGGKAARQNTGSSLNGPVTVTKVNDLKGWHASLEVTDPALFKSINDDIAEKTQARILNRGGTAKQHYGSIFYSVVNPLFKKLPDAIKAGFQNDQAARIGSAADAFVPDVPNVTTASDEAAS